ncbi:alpha/beta fold hydrolase [Nocardia flavorosea]|uniref:Alpha/beta hydrolase n=1 Tax=Nocardia flavorosea TaxID=53429 RepID=A0A846YFE1_9NOCA|nr:alpha/beta hydrolase [Nocardia flavorosea]NKY57733.1 alpha/beta hydrolase [Nocardia flavorosea]
MTDMETRTLAASGATLTYDIRGDLHGRELTPLLMVGSPMDATGFGTLAEYFTDRPVVTYDPRGIGRSIRDDGTTSGTPEEHADDIRRIIEALATGPVDILGSSGGAVNALTLVARHGELVRTLVAHEPPTVQFLPDRDRILAVATDITATYQRAGLGPAMAKFITLISHRGALPADYTDRPAPDPAQFGLPVADDGSRDDPMVGPHLLSCCGHEHDPAALAAAPTRIVLGTGRASAGELCARAAIAFAAALDREAVVFPGGHAGFTGGEFGMTGEPEAFAAVLREILDRPGTS